MSITASPVPATGRVQLALNVDDLQASIDFYTSLLGQPPSKVREGYETFAVDGPPLTIALLQTPSQGGPHHAHGLDVERC